MKPKRKKARRPTTSIFEGLSNFGEFNGPAAEIGLAVLSALSVAGIHSAINPSFFALKDLAKKPAERVNAVQGLWIGLGLGTLASIGLFFVFKKWVPAVVAGASALALFGIGMIAVNSNGAEAPTVEKKAVAAPPPSTTPAPQPEAEPTKKGSVIVMDQDQDQEESQAA